MSISQIDNTLLY